MDLQFNMYNNTSWNKILFKVSKQYRTGADRNECCFILNKYIKQKLLYISIETMYLC